MINNRPLRANHDQGEGEIVPITPNSLLAPQPPGCGRRLYQVPRYPGQVYSPYEIPRNTVQHLVEVLVLPVLQQPQEVGHQAQEPKSWMGRVLESRLTVTTL